MDRALRFPVARSRALSTLGWLGGVVLGLVLLVAAGLKALDPVAFAEEIAHQRVAFGLAPFVAALAALGIEAWLGAALLLNLRRLPVLLAATALVGFFVFLTARWAWRVAHGIEDAAASCGCFGNLVERTPREAMVQDLLLLVPPLALAWLGRPGARRAVAARWSVVTLITAATVVFAALAPGLPLDDVATRLRPGVELSQLCAGAGGDRICLPTAAPVLARGRHLVVITDPDAGLERLASRANAYATSGAAPDLVVLADLTPERQRALFWTLAPAFELQSTPTALLRPLYRRLPRSFEVADGRVVATWSGLPPALAALPEGGPRTENR